ncbi:hypothetical protein ACQKND_06785 [Viridibacillus arvi]|uniref:hypothetical protein n=1 Tax=Viridibacillus arvi TaxID=263475 RepID=UPI003D040E58
MGKFNLKFVKPVASLAIGAAVLTGSFAVTGAADTAFAKAATVKVSKGKLVSAKSGKAVKGYKSYKGILYKNGKKFTGLYKNTYYKSGKKGTGLYKNVYYKAGKKGSGWVGSGSSKKWYQDGKLLTGLGKNSGKLFIKGKYANGIVTYKGVEKLYKDGVVVKTVVDAAKAINNTTVEVTFAEAQKASDISAGRFAIEGLEITNAAVKQTDDKVIILTTAAQTGGKTYTVALDGVKSRTFKGVSNVQAKAITNLTPSLQGVIGKEVTVKTQVDVEAGQSKAGIAVTFNITNSADTSVGNFGKKITAEAFTDANGVASYSYTQYVAGTQDTVEVYPTGNASVKDTAAIVYWGNAARLAVSDVTTGTTLANNAKKVYKVVSPENAGGYVNVTFKENVGVTPDKLVRSAEVVDASLSSNGNARNVTPWQVTTGGVQYAQIKLNASGEGTFTVTGSGATVTPIVFADGKYTSTTLNSANYTGNYKLESTELQAQASAVTFDKIFSQKFNVVAEGKQNAAYDKVFTANPSQEYNRGGRDYTVTVTDKDGKIAPAGTKVSIAFKDGDVTLNNVRVNGVTVTSTNQKAVTTATVVGNEGKAVFTVTGSKDAYATPTVFEDNGSKNIAGLDDSDLQTTAETTYFVSEVVNNASLTVNDKDANQTVSAKDKAKFVYQSVDQNGFNYAPSTPNYKVTFEVSSTFADAEVFAADGTTSLGFVKAGVTGLTLNVNPATDGSATIYVKSKDGVSAANVKVDASASEVSLPSVVKLVSFTKYAADAIVTGTVSNVDLADKTFTITQGAKTYEYKYSGALAYKLHNSDVSLEKFESLLVGSTVTATKDANDKYTFNILTEGSSAVAYTDLATAIKTASAAKVGKTEGDAVGNQIVGSETTLDAAIAAAKLVLNNAASTTAQLNTAKTTLDNAVTAYNDAKVVALTLTAPALTMATPGTSNKGSITGYTLASGETFNVTSATVADVTVDAAAGLAVTGVKAGSSVITVQVKNAAGVVIKTGTVTVTVTAS